MREISTHAFASSLTGSGSHPPLAPQNSVAGGVAPLPEPRKCSREVLQPASALKLLLSLLTPLCLVSKLGRDYFAAEVSERATGAELEAAAAQLGIVEGVL